MEPKESRYAGHFGKKPGESAMRDERTVTTVAILAFPETTASVVYGMFDLFMSAGRDWGMIVDGRPGESLMRPLLVARKRESLAASNGIPLMPHASFEECPPVDIVCVPEIALPPGEPLDGLFDEEVAFLRRRHSEGALLASACSGAMLIAQAGLLDGHEATTHWAYCDVLSRKYPRVKVERERALVVSGDGDRIVMAGGGTTWLDLSLYLIARTAGVDAAMQVARVNLIDWHSVGQQPFARLARTKQVDDAVIGRCQTWIAEHYHEPSPVSAMISVSGLAERSFKRRFQQATGMSPLEYVHTLRLEEAKQMLEGSDRAMEEIALEVGYEDSGFFSRLFRRQVGMTPSHYRKRFGSMRKALEK